MDIQYLAYLPIKLLNEALLFTPYRLKRYKKIYQN